MSWSVFLGRVLLQRPPGWVRGGVPPHLVRVEHDRLRGAGLHRGKSLNFVRSIIVIVLAAVLLHGVMSTSSSEDAAW